MTTSLYSSAQPDSEQVGDAADAPQRRVSVCIVSHNAYGAIHGGDSGFIGGVEWQTSLLARWLSERGYGVSLLTWDEGGPIDEYVHGVRVLRICRQEAGLPGLRFFHPKWTGLIAAMRRANADVYYQNCGENVTGQIALWCRRHGRTFVFSAANDIDCDARLPVLPLWRDRWLYRYGLGAADRVIVQTERQQSMMLRNFGIRSTVIPMPCPRPLKSVNTAEKPLSRRVLWVGRVCGQKRPDRLIQLAEQLPDLRFDLVGPHFDDKTANAALMRAKAVPNVYVHGRIPPNRMSEFYSSALCLVSTSDYEGFPNTFLEAWSHGLPIVSLFDPDSIIAREELGVAACNMEDLVAGIRQLLDDEEFRAQIAKNTLAYHNRNHVLEHVMPLFERVLVDGLQGKAG
jgi:glycosyltransferase involved in cell wall biosynthesis